MGRRRIMTKGIDYLASRSLLCPCRAAHYGPVTFLIHLLPPHHSHAAPLQPMLRSARPADAYSPQCPPYSC